MFANYLLRSLFLFGVFTLGAGLAGAADTSAAAPPNQESAIMAPVSKGDELCCKRMKPCCEPAQTRPCCGK